MPRRKPKVRISDSEIEEIRGLVESLRTTSSSKTVEMTADLSDAMLKVFISSAKAEGKNKREAIKMMWEIEEWLTKKL